MYYSCSMCCPFGVECASLRWMFTLCSSVSCGRLAYRLRWFSPHGLLCSCVLPAHRNTHIHYTYQGKYTSSLSGSLAFTISCPQWIHLFSFLASHPLNANVVVCAVGQYIWGSQFCLFMESFSKMLMKSVVWSDMSVMWLRSSHTSKTGSLLQAALHKQSFNVVVMRHSSSVLHMPHDCCRCRRKWTKHYGDGKLWSGIFKWWTWLHHLPALVVCLRLPIHLFLLL